MWEEYKQDIIKKCSDLIKQNQDPSLMKCQYSCQLLNSINQIDDDESRRKWLQYYTQAVLDFTFYDENKMVEEDFPPESCHQRMKSIIELLNHPEELIKSIDNVKSSDVLDDELLECLYWRRGALCYMYCCTLDQANRANDELPHFLNNARQGVRYLQTMLTVRKFSSEDSSSNNDPVRDLLAKGAFSDTHVLAMMYSGELCAWILQYSDNPDTDIQYKSAGLTILNQYVSIVEGPLKAHGWDSSKAKELIEKLSK